MVFRYILLVTLALRVTVLLKAQLPPTMASRIDGVVTQALADGGVPSASIAVVRDNQVAYVKTYGNARLEPLTPARPDMRYYVGSVSKQFLAGSILLLVQDGKLSLDDRVARYLASLTRAGDITIRQLLSHTSGYQDYYPLDYVAPFMLVPVTADGILDRWARKPLDFEPGTEWQYSNTNYVAAGRIVEQVAGTSLMAFLKERIFGPLGMQSPIDLDQQPLAGSDASGYTRFGLGPARAAPAEARGWLFAAGELAMTARDLALWDISLMEGKLLTPASLQAMISAVVLKNGAPTDYALGVGVRDANGHPLVQHGAPSRVLSVGIRSGSTKAWRSSCFAISTVQTYRPPSPDRSAPCSWWKSRTHKLRSSLSKRVACSANCRRGRSIARSSLPMPTFISLLKFWPTRLPA